MKITINKRGYMKQVIIGFIVGYFIAAVITTFADSSYIGIEAVWNKIFSSSTNTINVTMR